MEMDLEKSAELLVEKVRNHLMEIDSLEISEHSKSFEAIHEELRSTLSTIDGL